MLQFHSLGECLWFVGSVSGWSCANGTLGVGFDHGDGLACSCLLGTIAEMLTPAGPVTCQGQGPRLGRSSWRARAYFLPLPLLCHLPKVLILQSASARAGADRTFSDQYLGQVPGEEGIIEKRGAVECCTFTSLSVNVCGSWAVCRAGRVRMERWALALIMWHAARAEKWQRQEKKGIQRPP